MDTQNIKNELEARRSSGTGLNEHQKLLSLMLGTEEFLTLLPDDQRNIIANINSNPAGYLDSLESNNEFRQLRFYYWSYLNNKRRGSAKFVTELAALESKIRDAETHLENIKKISGNISGATALTAYAKQFESTAKEHAEQANRWRIYLYLSIAAFISILAFIFFLTVSEVAYIKSHFSDEIRRNIDIASIAIKLAVIVGWAQVIRFFHKNYNAEKHLQQVTLHRKDVLQSLHAVYLAITDQAEKDTIIKIGAAVAFQAYETGYISRKEGAGNQDDVMTSLLDRIR